MRSQHIRDVSFLDLNISASPGISTIMPMGELIERVKALSDKGQIILWSKAKDRKAFARQIAISDDGLSATLLLYAIDSTASGASFAHMQTDVQRDEDKQEGEGRPESAHLVLSLLPDPSMPNRYPLLLEGAGSFPRAKAEQFLRAALRTAIKAAPADFTYPDPSGQKDDNGEPKRLRYSMKVSLVGYLSDDFMADLEGGALRGISLETAHAAESGFGEAASVRIKRKVLKLEALGSWKDKGAAVLQEALGLGKNNEYEAARVVFESADSASHTALIDTETGGTLNDGYIKRARLEEAAFFPEASITIHPVIEARMKSMLKKHMA